ncbi:hypothetical protein ACFWWC_01960 [Streptomyces sp. NPDC058642]
MGNPAGTYAPLSHQLVRGCSDEPGFWKWVPSVRSSTGRTCE